MTLWKDLVEIPKEVHKNDFVLKLTEGVQKKQHTVDTYVVTPQIAERFDQALRLIRSAVEGNKSVAAYLHGSFGSGKSHFMAVLNLLLEGFPPARQLENFGPVVAEHQEWIEKNRFLMIPYHFMNATSMEQAILGGYVDFIRKNHPEASLPGVYLSEKILANADELREKMGDDKFFASLNEGAGSGGGGGWGKLQKSWNADTYAAARHAEPGSESLTNLVGDVVAKLLSATIDTARAGQHGFVDLDEGLATISRHAASLEDENGNQRYQGLILFLDELVLWLASRAGDLAFLDREGPKISKLIEAQDANRTIPIISFVAKQRDLRDFIGDQHPGMEQFRVWTQLQYWDRGLDTIKLEDRNLPVIVEQRLLKPKDSHKKEEIRQSFGKTVARMKPAERDIMLGREADEALFAAVFPFSPVLVQALVALSALLHRERTALRLLLMLLVNRREDLELGQVIPVGDLWDVISDQQEPFSDVILQTFRSAQKLYDTRLRPMLLQQHGFQPGDEPDSEFFRNDDRIIKTLLVSTLVPGVEAFKDMTAARLVALNYGAVKTPIAGGEVSALVNKLRQWAALVGEIRLGAEAANPTVSLQLSNVDLEALLQRVQAQDNEGNRRRKIQEMLFQWFGLDLGGDLWTEYRIPWRGAQRKVQVSYRNVREMAFDQMESDGERWQVIIDYPFDDDEHFPTDDFQKLQKFAEYYEDGTDTLAWLPSFLSAGGREALGRIIKIDYIIDRFDQQVEHLATSDRPTVRAALQSLRSSLRENLRQALRISYGIDKDPQNDLVDHANQPQRHLVSLRPGFEPRVPGGVPFDDALRRIVEAALGAGFPAAPNLPDDTTTRGRAQKMADLLVDIVESGEASAFVEDNAMRKELAQWAVPLDLGQMGDNRFAPSGNWRERFNRGLSKGDQDVVVGELRRLIDPPDDPSGIPDVLQDLIILVYAAQENMVFRVGQQSIAAQVGDLPDAARLVYRKMPGDDAWEAACRVAAGVFGVTPGRMKNARNVERLVTDMQERAEGKLPSLRQIPEKLVEAGRKLDLDREAVEGSDRHRGATLLAEIVAALDEDATTTIETIAELQIGADDMGSMKMSLPRTATMLQVLSSTQWEIYPIVAAKNEPVAQKFMEESRAHLLAREHVHPLEKFSELTKRAIALIDTPSGNGGGPAPPHSKAEQIEVTFKVQGGPDQALAQLVDALKTDPKAKEFFENGTVLNIRVTKEKV